jgi:hypothetical protein
MSLWTLQTLQGTILAKQRVGAYNILACERHPSVKLRVKGQLEAQLSQAVASRDPGLGTNIADAG